VSGGEDWPSWVVSLVGLTWLGVAWKR